MNISETCIRRPVLTTLMTASLIVFGAFAYRLLPVAALPAVDFPTIQITATLPGASPETMAASVASPIERQLSTIAGISSMSSSSSLGISQITIQFDLGRNIDGASLDVQTALAVAQRRLPVEMTTPPFFRKVNPGDFPVLYVSMRSDTMPLSAVDDYAETVLAPQISQLPGIAQVLVFGAQKFAVRVQVDPVAAAARNISLDDIRSVVAKANSSAPVGTLQGEQQAVTLLATGAMNHAADYRDVVVAYRNGAPVKLNEVARVIDSVENDKIATWFNDARAIVLAIQRQPDANTVEVVDLVRNKLPAMRAQIPPAINMAPLFDRSISIRAAVHDVQETLAIAISLVIMVIFLFLRKVSATIIPALAVPVSLIGTCAAMYAFGFSINNMTLLGAHAVGRLRGRRRHRHAGEHRAPRRGRHAPVRGGAERLARDRLHHRIDHIFADRGVHPGAADGRHGRPRVPRIRGVDLGGDHRFRLRFAHAHADAVRARAQEPSRRREAEFRAGRVRALVRADAADLRMDARPRAQGQVDHALRDAGDHRRHHLALHRGAQGLFPAGRHRLRDRHHRG